MKNIGLITMLTLLTFQINGQTDSLYTSIDNVKRVFGSFYSWRLPRISYENSPFLVLLDSAKRDTLYNAVFITDSSLFAKSITCQRVSYHLVFATRRRELLRIKKMDDKIYPFNDQHTCTIGVVKGSGVLISDGSKKVAFLLRY